MIGKYYLHRIGAIHQAARKRSCLKFLFEEIVGENSKRDLTIAIGVLGYFSLEKSRDMDD